MQSRPYPAVIRTRAAVLCTGRGILFIFFIELGIAFLCSVCFVFTKQIYNPLSQKSQSGCECSHPHSADRETEAQNLNGFLKSLGS